ncbi:unannotated protein [freshwater metagenome]|uniref:Unannotated protein n=1 Tax=freshwater metagenome TaxID=449393 RepID=A0A6J7GZC3_9ZZZZ|nr:hypothetical protein [Actinomycetota bacterium]
MARRPKTPQGPAAYSLTAAARALSSRPLRPTTVHRAGWATEAWLYYDLVGELRYAVNWKANAASRARLVPAQVVAAGQAPVRQTNGKAADIMREFAGGEDGQAQLLSRLMIHLEVPGDSYLVGQDVLDDDKMIVGQRWRVFSGDEITQAGTSWTVNIGDGTVETLPDDAIVTRIWRPHPRRSWEADSPTRAVLPVLAELDGYAKHKAATVDSRLAGAGMLILPIDSGNPMAEPSAPTLDEEEGQLVDPAQHALTEAMVSALQNRGAASAVVPIVHRVPAEFVGKVQHITFGTQFDERLKELQDDAVRRLALGLDMPPEQLLGLGGMNHWGAWQVDETGLKLHIVPPLELIASALTESFLRPMLEEAGESNVDSWTLVVDVSDLEARPDKTQQALQAFDRFVINEKGLREALQLDEAHAPTGEELIRLILLRITMTGQVSPAIATALGLPPGIVVQPGTDVNAAGIGGPNGVGGGPPRALPGRPGVAATEPPLLSASRVEAMLAQAYGRSQEDIRRERLTDAAEVLVLRALERAGNKKRGRSPALAHIPDHETHLHMRVGEDELDRLLTGAWSLAPAIAAQHQVTADQLVLACDRAARTTLLQAMPWNRGVLEVTLEDALDGA